MPGYRHTRVSLTPSRRLLLAGPPIVATVARLRLATARRYDIVHCHGDVASMLALPLLRHRPSVISTHGLHMLRRSEGARRRTVERTLRSAMLRAGRTVCCSQAELAELRPLLEERDTGRLVHVANGMSPPPLPSEAERESARARLGLDKECVAGLYLGQLEPRKDPMTAIHAANDVIARGVPFRLLVAGDGPLAGQAQEEAGEGVSVLGFRSDATDLLTAADIFVLPSRWEGLSYAVLEAMSYVLAPVVSDGPGNPEAVGDAGVVVPVGQVAPLAAVLERLARDSAERERLGAAARARVEREFNSARFVDGMRAVYEDVRGPAPASS